MQPGWSDREGRVGGVGDERVGLLYLLIFKKTIGCGAGFILILPQGEFAFNSAMEMIENKVKRYINICFKYIITLKAC